MLSIQRCNKLFGTVTACDRVTLDVASGEFFSLLGPSGCGKTTLLKIIAGLIEPDGGTIALDGADITRMPPYRRNVNTIFQNYALFPHLNVLDNVSFGLRMKGVERFDAATRVAEVLELVALKGFERRRIQDLSGGQQQRVAVARAVVNRPSLLLLDEPMAALDVKLRKQMQVELRELQRRLGMTFLYVTHDQDEALRMSDRIGVMNHGRLEQVGSPVEIYDRPQTRFVAEFVGEVNMFTSDRVVSRTDRVTLTMENGVHLHARNRLGHPLSGTVTAAVRPEKITATPAEDPGPDHENTMRGTVSASVYLGTGHHYTVTIAGGQEIRILRQAHDHHRELRIGEEVRLSWSAEHTLVLGA